MHDPHRAIKIKRYIDALFAPEDQILTSIKKNASLHGLPDIHVPPNLGKLLYCFVKLKNPKKILEIGSLAGYSTVWLARALTPEGTMISLERKQKHVQITKNNLSAAGLADKVEVRKGDAQHLLNEMIERKEGPFDLIFIDADKDKYPDYLNQALQLSSSGTLILSDNLIPKKEEVDKPNPRNVKAKKIYQFNREIASSPHLESALVTTIVEDGLLDGFGISIVV